MASAAQIVVVGDTVFGLATMTSELRISFSTTAPSLRLLEQSRDRHAAGGPDLAAILLPLRGPSAAFSVLAWPGRRVPPTRGSRTSKDLLDGIQRAPCDAVTVVIQIDPCHAKRDSLVDLLGSYRFAAASRRRAGCCAMNPVSASRTTSASERRWEKAISRSAWCCSASIAAKSVTGSASFFSPTRAPRRAAPPLVTRSVFIADLLFINDQVLDRADEFQSRASLVSGTSTSISASTSLSTTP